MSQIPTPPALPKPKNLSKNHDAATAEQKTVVFVAMPIIDAETEKFLEAENLFPITSEWMIKHGFV